MAQRLWEIIAGFWNVVADMAPYLLLGFAVAGLLAVLVRPETVEKHLGGGGFWPVIKAAIFGVPLPLCSCGVIPVAASLRRHGASRGATTAFLISTPQTGVDSIAVTYSLLGPVFAVFRPIAALISGLVGGLAVAVLEPRQKSAASAVHGAECADECCVAAPNRGKIYRAFHYGFVALPQDIGKALLIGLVIAALITALVPKDFFAEYLGKGVGAVLVMMLAGIPFYVCATGSVPLALALIAKGITPGAALAFLITGPATNAATIAMVWKVMGRRTAIIYVIVIALTAFGSGLLLDGLFNLYFPRYAPSAVHVHAHHGTDWIFYLKSLAGAALLGILAFALFGKAAGHKHGDEPHGGKTHEETGGSVEKLTLAVSGMTCTHCANAVERAIRETGGVASAGVDLKTGAATVTGRDLDVDAMKRAIEELGYKVVAVERQNP